MERQKRVQACGETNKCLNVCNPLGVFEVKRFMSRGISGKKRTKTKKKGEKKKEKKK
ncbi:MAG: hypothetical protein KJ886_03465 [Candidatus Thermoplasmatota archaeon]|nr:hypothetical protein [Candidatus Thermoplasmatota archaeon]MCG2827614.1 hypothetical protein [Thermoplasmatales archaeon]